MGKSLPSPARLQSITRAIASEKKKLSNTSPKQANPTRLVNQNLRMESLGGRTRVPLSEVVSDCVKRWFHDALREAKAGDSAMQVLVGQMYNSGYGVRKDTEKGRSWIVKASRNRPSVWKVGDKQPGYNASDSDSDKLKDGAK